MDLLAAEVDRLLPFCSRLARAARSFQLPCRRCSACSHPGLQEAVDYVVGVFAQVAGEVGRVLAGTHFGPGPTWAKKETTCPCSRALTHWFAARTQLSASRKSGSCPALLGAWSACHGGWQRPE